MTSIAQKIEQKISSITQSISRWKINTPMNDEIDQIMRELDDVQIDVMILAKEHSTYQDEINELKYKLSLEVVQRERLQKVVVQLREENKTNESLLKLYDLCYMYNFYISVPLLSERLGYKNWSTFVEEFKDLRAAEQDSEPGADEKLNNLKNAVNSQLVDIDIEDIVDAGTDRHLIAHTDLRSATNQKEFLKMCETYDFKTAKRNELAKKVIMHLSTVEFKRIK
eukprot:gene16333-22250_t